MIIKSLEGIDFNTIFEAFNKAFKDYEMQLNKDELRVMLLRRGMVPELSFAAFKDNDIVGFTFNGIGKFNGIKTAYDTGTGTLPDYRGKGIATKIFNYSLPFLRQDGVNQYLLEVLQHNTKAVSVYKNIGFKVSREFNYYISKSDAVKVDKKTSNNDIVINTIEVKQITKLENYWDFHPSWQNSMDAINRNPDEFIIKGAFINDVIAGYFVFEPNPGDLTQLAVDKNHRRKGIATAMLKHILELNLNHSIKVINTDTNCNSITEFMGANSTFPSGKQFEMILIL